MTALWAVCEERPWSSSETAGSCQSAPARPVLLCMAAILRDAPVYSSSADTKRTRIQDDCRGRAGARKTSLAELLADDEWRTEAEALDAELHRLALPNDRLRLRFGEVLAKLGRRFRDLGFRRLDLYVRERASRPGRWGAEARLMAERLERFGHLREALVAGLISWSMAELLARYLEGVEEYWAKEEEIELLGIAREVTVREMRGLLRELQEEQEERSKKPGGRNASVADAVDRGEGEPEEEDRIRVRRLLPAHQAMTLEMTLRVIQHMSGGSTGDAFEWLLTEAQTSLIPQFTPEIHDIARDIEVRFLDRARRRAEAMAECELDEAVAEGAIPRTERDAGLAEDDGLLLGWLPDDCAALDRVIRELGFRIASAELYRGWTLAQFLALRGWALLGYVSETQYARERLGMSRAEMYRQARLARDCQRLPAIREAVRAGTLGSSHAGLLVRVATPKNEQAWLERARRRTVKHLKEEVDALERVGRYAANADDSLAPPTEAEMALVHAVDREVLTGRALRRALGISRPDLDGSADGEQSEDGTARPVRSSFLAYREVFEQATTYGLGSPHVEDEDALPVGTVSELTDMEIGRASGAESREGDGPDEASELPISMSVSSPPEAPPPGATPREASPPETQPRPKAAVTWSDSLRPDVLMFFQQLETQYRAAGFGGDFLDFALKDFLATWTPHLGKSDVWEHVYRRYRYRCTSPVCDSRR